MLALNQPSSICSTGQFSINNLPSSASVSWVSSDNAILTINSSGYATKVTSGYVTVGASITLSCGGIWLFSTQMFVGVPAAPGQPINSVSPICRGGSKMCTIASVTGATSYSWITDSPNIDIGTPCGGVTCATGLNNLIDGLATENYHIYITADNGCGSSSIRTVFVGVTTCGGGGGGGHLVAFPNPSNDKLTIESVAEASEVSTDVTSVPAPEYSIQIFDKDRNVIKNAVSTERKIVLDIASFPEGVYYLNILVGDEVIQKQILIQR
jgi:hypothetical protein